ncbi:MAG: pilus assembly protein PilP, partial [Psychrobacter sp.]|nr:pilus assembly protein PilP [Psychrobacter sp.]
MSKVPTLLILSLTVLSVTGCSDRIGMADQAMNDIRNQPAQPIEPPPRAELVEDFVYSAREQRSPFLPPSLVNVEGPTTAIDGVRPDIARVKEPLEQYELSQLVFRGVVTSPEGQRY